jgi:SCP-2 sterol transfer family
MMTPGTRSDPTMTFFEDLSVRGHEPLLRATGSLRIDVLEGDRSEHWYVTTTNGDVKVSHKAGRADTVIRAEKKVMDGMVKGTVNLMAAMLRGAIEVEGNLELLNSFNRLLPGPPRSRASFLARQEELLGREPTS